MSENRWWLVQDSKGIAVPRVPGPELAGVQFFYSWSVTFRTACPDTTTRCKPSSRRFCVPSPRPELSSLSKAFLLFSLREKRRTSKKPVQAGVPLPERSSNQVYSSQQWLIIIMVTAKAKERVHGLVLHHLLQLLTCSGPAEVVQ